MRIPRPIPVTTTILAAAAVLAAPAAAQKRAGATKEPDFPTAVAAAQKAFEAQDYGTAVSMLQAAMKAVQKLLRGSILAALPKPEGFTIRDDEPQDDAGNPFTAGIAALGMTVSRHYEKGDTRIDVEVTANSPMISMLSVMFANPALIKADGGELVEYGPHKAILKKQGDDSHELTILLHDKHLVKATANGMSADDLLVVFDQAAVDRLVKALGK